MENKRGKNCVEEELMVDLLQGRQDEQTGREALQHIHSCESCRKLYNEWFSLLQPSGAKQPRSITKTKIKRRLRWHWFVGMVRSNLLRKRWGAGMLAAVAVILLYIGIFRPHSDPWLQNRDMPATLPELKLVSHPGTILYYVPLAAQDAVTGYVWINSESGEMFIQVEGLPPLPEHDYQVWIVKADDRRNGGLLQLANGRASLYYTARTNQVREAEGIWISIEPKGGSLQPSGPDRVLVNLRENRSSPR